ncbi:hypothetical protein L9F63_011798, partial [Diploptera punctata]
FLPHHTMIFKIPLCWPSCLRSCWRFLSSTEPVFLNLFTSPQFAVYSSLSYVSLKKKYIAVGMRFLSLLVNVLQTCE